MPHSSRGNPSETLVPLSRVHNNGLPSNSAIKRGVKSRNTTRLILSAE